MSAENTNAGGGETARGEKWHRDGCYVYRNEYGAVGYVNGAGSNPGLITVVGVSGAEAEAVASRIHEALTRWSAADKGLWRTGHHYGIHIYERDRPVATFHRPEDAAWAVASVNGRSDAALSAQSTGSGGVAAEPVAWAYEYDFGYGWASQCSVARPDPSWKVRNIRPLYEHPPVAAEPVAELAQIRAMLLSDQGDDDGSQILLDFDEGMSVTAMVSRCVHLLEQRRDALDAYKLKSAEPRAKRSRLEAEGWSQASVVSCYWTSSKPDHELVPVVNLDLRKLYEATHELAAAPTPPAGGGETEPSDLGKVRKALLMAREAVAQKVESYRPWADKIAGRVNPWQPVLDAVNDALAEPATIPAAPRKGPTEEEIARALYEHDVPEPRFLWPIQNERMAAIYRSRARAITALLTPADRGETQAVGDGWRVVPVEPTAEMLKACWDGLGIAESRGDEFEQLGVRYFARMLAAAPSPDQNRGEPDQGGEAR